ncbi:MAG: SUMF1/EgtB/PvdO family nonheme iron enzyme, partial [Treponema sp.]|nr:SUMF1/EgtB/PvdO family nonheme iron enzyme [Treponema sp.]
GLRDMSGNVWEWCWDLYGGTVGSSGTVADPGVLTDFKGAASGSSRVMRGGGWGDSASICTVASRGSFSPSGQGQRSGVPGCLPLSSAQTGLTPERLDRRRKPPEGAAGAGGRGAPALRGSETIRDDDPSGCLWQPDGFFFARRVRRNLAAPVYLIYT